MDRYKWSLLAVFLLAWAWAAFSPTYRESWLLENYLIFVFAPIIIVAGRYFKLSNLSYTLLTAFMILHVIGAHYTYAEVPFGYRLQEWLGGDRNMYDRLVHFSFGFLLGYPLREIFMRLSKVKGFWAYYFPFDLTLALSAIYEIIEWATVRLVDPAAGLAFLGVQGDIWDAQKDMLMAATGAALAMIVTFLINWRFNRGLMAEFKESFQVAKGDRPLGEEKLGEYFRERTRRKRRGTGAR